MLHHDWSALEAVGKNGLSPEELEALRAEALRWAFLIVALGGLAAYLWLGA